MAEVTGGLFDAARSYLDITWDDPEGDRKLSGILMRGMTYLDRIAGTALDYDREDTPRALLFDYARYVRSGALDEFQQNYLHELLAMQIGQEAAHDDPEEASRI